MLTLYTIDRIRNQIDDAPCREHNKHTDKTSPHALLATIMRFPTRLTPNHLEYTVDKNYDCNCEHKCDNRIDNIINYWIDYLANCISINLGMRHLEKR